jgi:hypothetical protein
MVLAVSPLQAYAATFDESMPPDANYDKAEFRLWLPDRAGRVLAFIVNKGNV